MIILVTFDQIEETFRSSSWIFVLLILFSIRLRMTINIFELTLHTYKIHCKRNREETGTTTTTTAITAKQATTKVEKQQHFIAIE